MRGYLPVLFIFLVVIIQILLTEVWGIILPLDQSPMNVREDVNYSRIKRQNPTTKRNFLPDFLEVPVSTKRTINATTPDPIVILHLSSYDLNIPFGDTVDIGSLLNLRLQLDKNSSGIYGLRLQKLEAIGGDVEQYREPLVRDGCPALSVVTANISPVDRSTVDVSFRAFRFPVVAYVKYIATVRVCIQRCQKIHCGGKPQRPRRELPAFIPWNFTTTTPIPYKPIQPSTKMLRKKAEYEIVTISAVEVKGYNRKYIAGLPRLVTDSGTQNKITFSIFIISFFVIYFS